MSAKQNYRYGAVRGGAAMVGHCPHQLMLVCEQLRLPVRRGLCADVAATPASCAAACAVVTPRTAWLVA